MRFIADLIMLIRLNGSRLSQLNRIRSIVEAQYCANCEKSGNNYKFKYNYRY